MTHHEDDTTIAQVMETLIENGMENMGKAFGILYNAAMEIERAQFWGLIVTSVARAESATPMDSRIKG